MNLQLHAVRLGLFRAWTEFRQSITTRTDQVWIVSVNGIFIVVLLFQRNADIPGTDIPLALATLPSLLGMNVMTGGWMQTATTLSAEREDGTLLRAKATPNGMIGYLVARIALSALNILLGFAIFLVFGLTLLDGLGAVGVGGWLILLAVFVVGLLATLPWGAMLGSLVKSSGAGFGLSFLPASLLIGISGIFYPISGLPDWLHPIAQIFPVYWLGLGMRSALLPDQAALAEIGESWRHLETFGMLGLWAVVGLALAPRVLRRMAQRESGSAVEERRQRAMQMGT
ncbi:MAG TPA: ABC transporter permease [Kineosporiaceae bacterium]|nr:ABC transporter permease [Kineosporiaceae bacterium]